jgi:hypothetical protein
MITFLISNWKIIATGILLASISFFSYQQGYNNRDNIALKEQIIIQEKLNEAKKVEVINTDRIVTQYVNKIITVEKLVPYFVDRTKTEITEEENLKCTLPKSFLEIYKDSLGVNQ